MICGKIFALIIGVRIFLKLTWQYKLIFCHVFIAMFCEIYGRYIALVMHEHNVWLFNSYLFVGELLLMGIPAIGLINKKALKYFGSGLLFISTILWVTSLLQKGLNYFSPVAVISIYASLLIMYFVILFDCTFSSGEKLFTKPNFWLSLSVIIFFCCNIPNYGMYNYLYQNHPALQKSLFNITLILDFIRYPLTGYSFYLLGKQKPEAKITSI